MKKTILAVMVLAVVLAGNNTNAQTVSGTENGHDYVDMGEAGLWATCNVGATKPEEYGNYYSWGETTTKSKYREENYKWLKFQELDYDHNEGYYLTKYCYDAKYGYDGFTDTKTVLDPEDDAAHVNWGGKWRMPTIEEWYTLENTCKSLWRDYNGVRGYLFIAPNNNRLFLPAADTGEYSSEKWKCGYYWSNSLDDDNPEFAFRFCFTYGYEGRIDRRYVGLPVRAVCDK